MRLVVVLMVGLFLMALCGCPASDNGGSDTPAVTGGTSDAGTENPCMGGEAADEHAGHDHAAGEGHEDGGENPCGENPCGDNPCGDNPCGDNPCGDNPCNPCGGGENPCGH